MFSTVEEILQELKEKRKPFVLVDSGNRENEGDIVVPVQLLTREIMNFAVTHCRGVPCVCVTEELCKKLELTLLRRSGIDDVPNVARFVTTIEAREGVTTGISVADRVRTMGLLVQDNVTKDDFVSPGHVFPLMIDKDGLEARLGHTEGSATFACLAGFKPESMICEILDEQGDSARLPYLTEFIKKHDLRITSIDILHRYLKERGMTLRF
ncbi:3,4-dihydroxy-2-butanone 4-phosphate synthase family protein [Neorickettsia helminthoeca str. Oregon]|uniref:3,4-dihydroxy-2-butanone 4-phosphate synthase n=1 Tax=Neorickettsia helminthoeca str. Oregon TaxID=1286528 RepID=X5HM85_9RICK|nr:3,4-dihydroxy-2-butanone-4-phosphate synthase [Neorickettsia helminthoeca]AHX11555.1 3,4-dihydroxy-2-butanone 4-phosphate synthase family protein [Neorickettsia helminthoeca str. Oregon]